MSRTLVLETATAACSVALIEHGVVIAKAHEVVGRGHAERLIPMIADLPGGGRADAILVDCGPGSFTGIRVGIAAARGLALGWGARLTGYTSLHLLAATAFADDAGDDLAVILEGGHGEVFMQGFAPPYRDTGPFASLKPEAALSALAGRRAIGSGVRFLTALDPSIVSDPRLPDASNAVLLPPHWATLEPKPIYGRAPDAKPLVPAA
ncbi:tRNA (adenosine(37)-N6)-threonylcarbamoyltransferase complex dimerization subunit type 1 TsaB [Sphingomonas glacialis]|uniref:tRNA (Adenosine(37)-N6)-threonylcarbamoyltransferase complex dimerization subunit type 1 TsaB n=1 Tax=Sphingomonas glacialis TaxID=658225 RepID=A0A502FJY9_9SPHN|nr:tRNA (adenosine(37)-N6)-threonylcarbamoyltransferase complex dimerization subunit type 1 TsaB [Sphingomonas glacialis]TPG49775.1 tRNA (adenosine(37)-N6)-threonylcarbamoyltransferase complex dimerization subunit type 1 TsaB [Sphingomonas glacialis]